MAYGLTFWMICTNCGADLTMKVRQRDLGKPIIMPDDMTRQPAQPFVCPVCGVAGRMERNAFETWEPR